MTHEELRRKVRSVAGIIAKQDPSRMQQLNAHVLEEADAEYRRFKEDFDRNICYLCGRPLASFSEKNVCLHWLLKGTSKNKRFLVLLRT